MMRSGYPNKLLSLGPSESVRENFTRYCLQRQKVRKKISTCFSLLSDYMGYIGALYLIMVLQTP